MMLAPFRAATLWAPPFSGEWLGMRNSGGFGGDGRNSDLAAALFLEWIVAASVWSRLDVQ